MQDKLTPIQVLLSCLTVSSFAGLAALLRSQQELNWRNVTATCLYSGVFGLIYGLIWFNYFGGAGQNYYFLIGSSGLIGLGGASLIDFVLNGLLHGFNITITPKKSNIGPNSKQGGKDDAAK